MELFAQVFAQVFARLLDFFGNAAGAVLDYLFYGWIGPFFGLLARGGEILLLKPLEFLHVPVAGRVAAVAVLVGLLSGFLRRVLRYKEHDGEFQRFFAKKQAARQDLPLLADQRARQVLHEGLDREIDEEFNSYLARRFSLYGLVYLLPVFLSMAWLESVFADVAAQGGLVARLPENGFGVEGLSIGVVFFVCYLMTLICGAVWRKFRTA